MAAIVDVTERHQDEERIRHLANFDALTGLPNRNLFMDRLTQAVNTALRGAQRVAVMFIDLDGFKLVNDTFGHDGGDEVLRELARRLSANVRVGDTVARLGGDEFTVIMPNLPSSEPALVVAQRMVASIELPYRIGNQDALVSASIGIALYPDDGREVHTLVRNADAAMYQAEEFRQGALPLVYLGPQCPGGGADGDQGRAGEGAEAARVPSRIPATQGAGFRATDWN